MASKNVRRSIQVRLDGQLKDRAEKVFAAIGIDTPTAIRIFFMKVADVGGIPFPLVQDEERLSKEQIAAIDRLAREAKAGKNLSPAYNSAEDLIRALRS